ncbi:FkbM family methyltransferase [Anabaena azotica]|uniref:FkbM family methyltransferase n=1 Tax=Anabaena azotica TaxID=197653 RepID=UPI0039A5BAA0
MNPMEINNNSYLEDIKELLPSVNHETLEKLSFTLDNTSWDDPTTSADWNNIAVVTLMDAQHCTDIAMRSVYLEMAIEALNNGFKIDKSQICSAHLALIHNWLGEKEQALQLAFSTLLNCNNFADTIPEDYNPYLVYVFIKNPQISEYDQQILENVLQTKNCYQQAMFLLSEIISCSQIVFYNPAIQRFLYLSHQISDSLNLKLKIGIANLMAKQAEGLVYLQQARKLQPNYAPTLQSLYLTYRDFNHIQLADKWLKVASEFYQSHSSSSAWQWTKLSLDSLFTYVPFEKDFIIAVEPSLKSIVTSVLLTEQDWFEKEMEFWRSYIKPGMTVIDVGANVGVYTFSAALKVGNTGRVLAVEPFSGCVRCLQETCRINNLSWVKVCAGAASDKNSTIKLLLHASNELNEVITDDTVDVPTGNFEEVSCFTLDSLIEQENIQQVDFIKMDAEGHEMAVLAGSKQLINQFKPIILYENIAGLQGSNTPVAQYIESIGYQLFYYQSFLQKLIPVNSPENYQQLNFIALPPEKISMFNF